MADLSIERLPVEIIQRIFDHLDVETIIFSIRPLCHLFRSIVTTYDRYILNFHEISKLHFYIFSRQINPQNVISLTLSNDNVTSNQIDLFISFHHLQQFTRLRSFKLIQIDESQLQLLLSQLRLNLLKTFSFTMRNYNMAGTETTTDHLTSLFSQANIQKLVVDIKNEQLLNISLPMNYSIQYLTLTNDITIENLSKIFECCPQLHTLKMCVIPNEMISYTSSKGFPQLSSLTVIPRPTTIDNLESFLLLTPSLVHLHIFSWSLVMDGKRWESFITTNLPQLNKFDFSFVIGKSLNKTPEDLELIISSFQTPFWLEQKKWFVNYEYDASLIPTIVYLYSIRRKKYFHSYEPKSQKCFASTNPMIVENDGPGPNSITTLSFNLNKSLADDIERKNVIPGSPLFPKATNIILGFERSWPLLSLQTLSVFINISQIIRMTITGLYNYIYNENTWRDFEIFFNQAQHLSELIITDNYYRKDVSNEIIECMSNILPYRLKHLRMPLKESRQIQTILERCEKLTTIIFFNKSEDFCENAINWFADNTINTTCHKGDRQISVWLGKKNF